MKKILSLTGRFLGLAAAAILIHVLHGPGAIAPDAVMECAAILALVLAVVTAVQLNGAVRRRQTRQPERRPVRPTACARPVLRKQSGSDHAFSPTARMRRSIENDRPRLATDRDVSLHPGWPTAAPKRQHWSRG